MKREEPVIRDQSSETGDEQVTHLQRLVREAIPPMEDDPELERDLWPAMLRQMQKGQPMPGLRLWPVSWFDVALAGALAVMAVAFPATIPVLLYYL